jgi:hypothetical protein
MQNFDVNAVNLFPVNCTLPLLFVKPEFGLEISAPNSSIEVDETSAKCSTFPRLLKSCLLPRKTTLIFGYLLWKLLTKVLLFYSLKFYKGTSKDKTPVNDSVPKFMAEELVGGIFDKVSAKKYRSKVGSWKGKAGLLDIIEDWQRLYTLCEQFWTALSSSFELLCADGYWQNFVHLY